MRASIIHITNHAKLRWIQRIDHKLVDEEAIIEAVRKSKIIKSADQFPFPSPRVQGTTYAVYGTILFILESKTIDEFVLITVVTESCSHFKYSKNFYNKKNKKISCRNSNQDMAN